MPEPQDGVRARAALVCVDEHLAVGQRQYEGEIGADREDLGGLGDSSARFDQLRLVVGVDHGDQVGAGYRECRHPAGAVEPRQELVREWPGHVCDDRVGRGEVHRRELDGHLPHPVRGEIGVADGEGVRAGVHEDRFGLAVLRVIAAVCGWVGSGRGAVLALRPARFPDPPAAPACVSPRNGRSTCLGRWSVASTGD